MTTGHWKFNNKPDLIMLFCYLHSVCVMFFLHLRNLFWAVQNDFAFSFSDALKRTKKFEASSHECLLLFVCLLFELLHPFPYQEAPDKKYNIQRKWRRWSNKDKSEHLTTKREREKKKGRIKSREGTHQQVGHILRECLLLLLDILFFTLCYKSDQ